MSAVLIHRTISVDGFIAGPDHEMDWIFEHQSPDRAGDVMRETGSIIAGKRSFEVNLRDGDSPGGAPYGGAWKGSMFVLTNDPPKASAGGPIFLSGDIGDAIGTAKEAASGKKVELFGADVTTQALGRGLVDEILVHVAPVLLGTGIPFLTASDALRVDLEPTGSERSGDLTTLSFRVKK